MSQPAIKRRLIRCHARTFLNLTENYKAVHTEPKSSPFHFMSMDELGIKYTRVEIDGLKEKVKKEIEEYRKKCPPNSVFEVRIFYKYKKLPERIII